MNTRTSPHLVILAILFLIAFAITAILWLRILNPPSNKAPIPILPDHETVLNNSNPLKPPPAVDPRRQLPHSPFNDLLLDNLTPRQQTDIIGNILQDYWLTHRSLPAGSPEEIYQALSGKNRSGAAYAPRQHPAFTAAGFQAKGDQATVMLHVRSSREGVFELIHTGPDSLPYTQDDQIRRFPN
ncbi:MAG: hypothetical protein AAGC74_07735 [Verrucomicrobiota bacterium]